MIYVTGGAGMIGSHLVERLAALEQDVVVVDNFCRGHWSNLANVIDGGRVTVRQVDLEEQDCSMPGASAVFHLAAKVTGIEYNRSHHYDMLMRNLAINANVMRSVLMSRPELFISVSTACI